VVRLGFAVRAFGQRAPRGRIKSLHDFSHWLVALHDMLRYLQQQQIRYYRLAPPSDAAWAQLGEYKAECAALQPAIMAAGLRLSIHVGHHVVLNSVDPMVAERSVEAIVGYGRLLDALGCGGDGTIVLHGSSAGGQNARERFAAAYHRLPTTVQRRVAVEHGEDGWSLGDLLLLHERCGVSVVLDCLHLQLYNPERLRLAEALALATATWPPAVPAEVHLSSQRTEGHLLPARGGRDARVIAPRVGQHADFIAPHDVWALLEAKAGVGPFDLMLEAKAGDLALLRMRAMLARVGAGRYQGVW
jgi:UV DNA damage endonuclease